MEFYLIIFVFMIIFLYFIRKIKKKKNEENVEKPFDSSLELKNNIYIVAGTTDENENGESIQSIIQQLTGGYEGEGTIKSFGGMTDKKLIKILKEGNFSHSVDEFENEYIFDVINLVPDPNNKYDENTIKVYIKDINDVFYHVGYISKEDNISLNNKMIKEKVEKTILEFKGGNTKVIDDEGFLVQSIQDTRSIKIAIVFN